MDDSPLPVHSVISTKIEELKSRVRLSCESIVKALGVIESCLRLVARTFLGSLYKRDDFFE